jgi:hypothetical protein
MGDGCGREDDAGGDGHEVKAGPGADAAVPGSAAERQARVEE